MLQFDAYQVLRPRAPDRDAPVAIVEIDGASLARAGQWPWSRARLAQIVERLADAGARVIAIDLILAEPDRLSPESLAAIAAERPDLAPLVAQLARQGSNDALLATAIGKAPVVLGFVGESEGEMWLRYAGYDPARSIPAHQMLDNSFDRARINGKFVLLGVSASGLLDLRSTTAVPGVAIHAEALEQILSGNGLYRPAYATGMEIVFHLLAGLAVMALRMTRPWTSNRHSLPRPVRRSVPPGTGSNVTSSRAPCDATCASLPPGFCDGLYALLC